MIAERTKKARDENWEAENEEGKKLCPLAGGNHHRRGDHRQ